MLFEVGLLFARLIESKDTEDHNDDEENRIIKIDK